MPRIKKRIQKQDLARVKTWITDTNPFSDYFRLTQVPDVLPGGKSGFLINGMPNLVRTTEILIELIDADGNTIFNQPIKNYQEGLARVVSFEVYEDTPPGPAVLTILGELAFDKDGNRVPDEWIGTYNVKWQKIINIEPTRPNTSTIRLYNRPVLDVEERLIPFRQFITGSIINISSGSIQAQYVPAGVQLVGTDINNLQRRVTTAGTVVICSQPIFTRSSLNSGIFYTTVNGNSYTSSIESIQSNTTAKLRTIATSSAGTPLPTWATNAYTMSFQQDTSFITSSLNRSFAKINLTNLTTFTGDIQRAKFYMRGVDQNQTYELLDDIILESTELTTTQSFTGEYVSLGEIIDQVFINTYWTSGIISNGITYLTGSAIATYDSTTLLDSVVLTGATGSTYDSGSNVAQIWSGINEDLTVEANTEYTFQADLVCLKSNPDFDAKLEIRLFGPNLTGGQNNQLGYLVTSIMCEAGQLRKTLHNFSFNFTTPLSDTAQLRFVIYGGEWFVSKAKIVSARESGFNPDAISVFSPVMGRRFERLQFKAELYDANSNLVPLKIETDPIYFDGGNLYVRGTDNRIDGIITVSPSGSGPLLTSKGFYDINNNFTPGQAIAIGEQTPTVFSKNTAFFAGTSSLGPQISVGDKMYGYYDFPTNQFILIIRGQLVVGSGSAYTNILSLLPSDTTDKFYDRVTGGHYDGYENRGRRALSAGLWNDQEGRLGLYTRGRSNSITGSSVTSSFTTGSINPFIQTGSVVWLVTSTSINVPPSGNIYNETIYGNINMSLTQLPFTSTGTYYLDYQIDVLTDWSGYPSTSASGQRLVRVNGIVVTNSGSFSPPPIFDYPIPIPAPRTSNTLYIVTKVTITASPSN